MQDLAKLIKIIELLKDDKENKEDYVEKVTASQNFNHPMLGKRCLVRTYSAGVHIGDVVWINPNNSMELKLENALRLWKWENGGLSLSAVANNGIKGGRLNETGEVFLTNAIELIPNYRQIL